MSNLVYDPYKDSKEFKEKYSNRGFWEKLKGNFSKISNNTIEKALTLYYALRDEDTPAWAKTVIAGALGYFIFPIDAVPDILPALGYSDDVLVLIAALTTVGLNLKDKHTEKAKEVIKKWYSKVGN